MSPAVVLAPGATYSCSFTGAVSGNAGSSHTDVVTASGTDDDGNPVSDTDDATVTITNVAPTVVVLKSANPTSVTEPGASVTFTVSVQNTSAEAVTLTTLTDDKFGNLNGQGTCATGGSIAAGTTYTCSFSGNVTGAGGTTHTNTVTGTVTDDDNSTATDTDDATVNITAAPQTARIAPTATSCLDYANGNAGDLNEILYGVKGNKIANVAPGVLFYYYRVTISGAEPHTLTVIQSNTGSLPNFGVQQDQAILYTNGCVKITQNNTGSFSGVSNGTYIIGIKYDPSTVIGATKPGGDVTYTFKTFVDGSANAEPGSTDSILLKAKPKGA